MIRRALLAAVGALALSAGHAQDIGLPTIERIELDNGAVFLLSEKHDVPLIGAEALLRGGVVSDPASMSGLSSLLAGLLEKGSGERDAASFAEAVASVGGRVWTGADREAVRISAEFLSADAELMIGLISDMLQRPALAAVEFERLRERQINYIRAAKDSNIGALIRYYGDAFLFAEHPYGRPTIGSESTLAAIGHRDVLGHYREHIGADRLVIAVSGDFDISDMEKRLRESFAGWGPAAVALDPVPAPQVRSGRRVLLIDKPAAAQTHFWITNTGVAVDFPARAELEIANSAFGETYTSMLMTALREDAGLTYGVRSTLQGFAHGGALAIASFTGVESTSEAVDITLEQLDKLRQQGLDETRVAHARNYILGQFPLRFETPRHLAAAMARLEFFGLGTDYYEGYIERVKRADAETIHEVIRSVYPAVADLDLVFIGDGEKIRDAIAAYGPITEMALTLEQFHPAATPAVVEAGG